MTWDPTCSQKQLLDAIVALDAQRITDLCEELIAYVQAQTEPYQLRAARQILGALRDGRRFVLLQRVADALIQAGRDDGVIRRHYAQALLDQGNLSAAVAVLERLASEMTGRGYEYAETRGLLGRAFKQMYVAATTGPRERRKRFLERAIAEYRGVYEETPNNRWHGINAVALLARAGDDGIELSGVDDPRAEAEVLAREILDEIEALGDEADKWDHGTAMEACIALGDTEQALVWLDTYLRAGVDAFSVASTLRQLTEVWNLGADTEPGAAILPVLQAELLSREGGPEVVLGAAEIATATADRIEADPRFERVLGNERFDTLMWFRTALQRCRSVARIEDPIEGGIGTGFLVEGADLHPSLCKVVLVTNAHVLGPQALAPERALITFRALDGLDTRCRVARLLWTSPKEELDTTIVELQDYPAESSRCPVAKRRPILDTEPPPRTYIIGHPTSAEQVMLSVRDNQLLDADEIRLHYRTPTEGGSSGSPVFNRMWELIALHHAGDTNMRRLHGKAGTYSANEGIWIERIVAELRVGGLEP